MSEKTNTITWAGRTDPNQLRTIHVTRVTLLHRQGQREAGRISLGFDEGAFRYRVALVRLHGTGQFEGTCEQLDRESESLVRTLPVHCLLLDSLESDALILGLTPWADERQQEHHWMGRFMNVQRVIGHEQEG
jgi:hypothetical protein